MEICRVEDCVIAYGIPTSRREFMEYRVNSRGRSLLMDKGIDWRQYSREIVNPFATFKRLGVNIVTGLTVSTFGALLAAERTKVVILVSHWKDETIELFDGMVEAWKVAEAIPRTFNGLIDLCVCRSFFLGAAIKEKRPSVLVKLVEGDAAYELWFGIYRVMFQLLKTERYTYIDALVKATEELIRS